MKKSIIVTAHELEILAELLNELNEKAETAAANAKEYEERAAQSKESGDSGKYESHRALDYWAKNEAILNIAENIANGKAPF